MRFPFFDVKHSLVVVGVWWHLWQVFLVEMVELWCRGGCWSAYALLPARPGPPSNYLPPPATGIQSGQGQGDSEGRVHAGGEGSNLRV